MDVYGQIRLVGTGDGGLILVRALIQGAFWGFAQQLLLGYKDGETLPPYDVDVSGGPLPNVLIPYGQFGATRLAIITGVELGAPPQTMRWAITAEIRGLDIARLVFAPEWCMPGSFPRQRLTGWNGSTFVAPTPLDCIDGSGSTNRILTAGGGVART